MTDSRERGTSPIDRAFRALVTTKEDRAWNAFMEKRREWTDFTSLIRDPETLPVFQQRAIQVLLAPSLGDLPFKVNVDRGSGNYLFLAGRWIDDIDNEQAQFVAGLLPQYLDDTKRKAERAQAANRYDDGAGENAERYNLLILGLLGKLPRDAAESLFEQFDINDPMAYMGFEEASGYKPLERLLFSDLQEDWKKKGLERLHEIIKREETREAQPRREWEGAVHRYGQILGLIVGGRMPISHELFEDEVRFLLAEVNSPVFDDFYTEDVLRLLHDKEMRHAFARKQVLAPRNKSSFFDKFSVYESTEEATRMMMAEFPEDSELVDYLQEEIDSYRALKDSNREKAEREKEKETRVRNGLRFKRN